MQPLLIFMPKHLQNDDMPNLFIQYKLFVVLFLKYPMLPSKNKKHINNKNKKINNIVIFFINFKIIF